MVYSQIAKLMVQLSKSQDDEIGDGTTGVVGRYLVNLFQGFLQMNGGLIYQQSSMFNVLTAVIFNEIYLSKNEVAIYYF